MPLSKRASAEFIGAFWLVFGGCGSAVLAAAFPGLGIGFAGVALAFRPHGPDHGACNRPHFGMSLESRCIAGIGCEQAISHIRAASRISPKLFSWPGDFSRSKSPGFLGGSHPSLLVEQGADPHLT